MSFFYSFKKVFPVLCSAAVFYFLPLNFALADNIDDLSPSDIHDLNVNIKTIYIQNTVTHELNRAVLIIHHTFNPAIPADQAVTISLGAYGAPFNDKTFEEEFGSWLPASVEYLHQQPQAVVIVPDEPTFGLESRAGAIDASVGYLTDEAGPVKSPSVGTMCGSLGCRGNLYYVEHPERFTTLNKVTALAKASPWTFPGETLTEQNIARMSIPIEIFVGDAESDPTSYASAMELQEAIKNFNPSLHQETYVYPGAPHGFFTRYGNLPGAEAGEDARTKAYNQFETSLDIEANTPAPSLKRLRFPSP